jgi:DNA-binding SARP family transcriptional activator
MPWTSRACARAAARKAASSLPSATKPHSQASCTLVRSTGAPYGKVRNIGVTPICQDATTSSIRISLTGRVAVDTGEGTNQPELQRRQTRLAFAALTLNRSAPVAREELAEILWPGELPATWETALRGTISRVRAVLAGTTLDSDALSTAFGCYQLHLPADAVVDIEEAQALVDRAEEALAAGHFSTAADAAARAREISRRPFLADCAGHWVEAQQARLRAWEGRALVALAEAAARAGDQASALAAAEEAIAREPHLESAHRAAIRAHLAANDRGGALAVYERCRRVLAHDLGVDPSPETEAAYLDALGAEPTLAAVARGQLPFVGRRAEMELLAAAWAEAREGRPGLVVLRGEPGSGKSRLAHEFAAAVARAGALVLWGRDDSEVALPFRPVVESLDTYVRTRGIAALAPVGPTALELARLSTELATALGVSAVAGAELAPDGGGDAARWRLFEAVRRWLATAAAAEPVLLVIEDLHWSAPATVALLRHVLDSGDATRLLAIATCRTPEGSSSPELATELGLLYRSDSTRRLELAGLDVGDVGALLAHVPATSGAPDHEALAARLVDQTGGNALFVGEAIRYLAIHGVGDAAPDLPAAVSDLVHVRCRTLGRHARVLELAALAGERVPVAVLEQAYEDADAVAPAVRRAEAEGLVLQSGGEVRFRHDVIRSVLADNSDPGLRPAMHRALAGAFAAQGDADASRLAFHWRAAAALGPAEAEEAIRVLGEAARQAWAITAFEQAAEHFAAALDLLDTIDPAGVRATERCDLLIELGQALNHAGNPAHREVLGRAAGVARQLGDAVRLAHAALALAQWISPRATSTPDDLVICALRDALEQLPAEEAALRVRVQGTLALESRWGQKTWRENQLMADEAVDEARTMADDETIATTLVARSGLGQLWPAEALRDAHELTRIASRLNRATPAANAAVMATDAYIQLGELQRADEQLARLEAIAQAAHLPYFQWLAMTRRTGQHALLGEYQATEAAMVAAAEFGAAVGVDSFMLLAGQVGLNLAMQLEQDRAAEIAEVLGALESAAGDNPFWQASLAVAAAEACDVDSARRQIDVLVAAGLAELPETEVGGTVLMHLSRAGARLNDPRIAILRPRLEERTGQFSWMSCVSFGPFDLALAWVAMAEGDNAGAVGHLHAAADLCRRTGARPWLRRAELEAARLAT